MHNIRIALGAGVAALLLGAIGPWISALGVLSVGPTINLEVSIVVFGGAALVALAVILNRALRAASMTIGVLALGEVVYVMVRLQEMRADEDQLFAALVQPGWGLYVTALAGAFLIASTWIIRSKPVGPTPLGALSR